jgi:two-component system, NtrC family, nitrogen regulation response regulator NtrX
MNILIIDDDKKIIDAVTEFLRSKGHKIFSATDGIEGYKYFSKEKIDACFIDVFMPKIGGIELLEKIKDEFPEIEVVMISGDATINLAVKATKLGAYDFIEKPITLDDLEKVLVSIERRKKEGFKPNQYDLIRMDAMIGESPAIKTTKELIENAARSDARILITGENGTGKELIAREIHLNSARRKKPFIGVNCAAIPENLIESELFGHVKGSFTGAAGDRIGKFELANTGTLFLDEIADMSLPTQAKVLRVLQEMTIMRIGSSVLIDIDVRIIAATNKDLKEEIKNGNFREDLFYRLNVVPFCVPSLRERKEDIPLLAVYFMKQIAKENKKELKTLDPEAMEFMVNYSWPGNVRQLRNIVERLDVMVDSKTISISDVKKNIDDESVHGLEGIISGKYEKYKLNVAREAFEKDFIEKKLNENGFNITKTAKALGIYPSNLYSKMNKLGIEIEDIRR